MILLRIINLLIISYVLLLLSLLTRFILFIDNNIIMVVCIYFNDWFNDSDSIAIPECAYRVNNVNIDLLLSINV